jgi:hypothetical protein
MFIKVRRDEKALFVVRPSPKGRTGVIVDESEFVVLKLLCPFVNFLGFIIFSLTVLLSAADIIGVFFRTYQSGFSAYFWSTFFGMIAVLSAALPRLFFTFTLADKPKIFLDNIEVIPSG